MQKEIPGNALTLSLNSSLKGENNLWEKKFSALFKKKLPQIEGFLEKFFKESPSSQHYYVSLNLCGRAKIISLNDQYRNKNKVTDVLSFPIFESLRVEKKDITHIPDIEFGDIYVCYEVASKQSREFKISVEEEIVHLFIHGFLHLLGYDHEISLKEEKIMEELEEQLLRDV
jgi:probable rRNA maturation factor